MVGTPGPAETCPPTTTGGCTVFDTDVTGVMEVGVRSGVTTGGGASNPGNPGGAWPLGGGGIELGGGRHALNAGTCAVAPATTLVFSAFWAITKASMSASRSLSSRSGWTLMSRIVLCASAMLLVIVIFACSMMPTRTLYQAIDFSRCVCNEVISVIRDSTAVLPASAPLPAQTPALNISPWCCRHFPMTQHSLSRCCSSPWSGLTAQFRRCPASRMAQSSPRHTRPWACPVPCCYPTAKQA